ncbi:UNVERIFIED_CONTAM: hypothetical protein GTU68_030486, partial [Idotea baltica]|nr:hypothetical protein [Idotea baltica]
MNSPEWHYILGGVIGSAIQGCMMPGFAVLFGNVLGTLSVSDPVKAQHQANMYSLLFLILGIIAAISMF